MGIRLVLLSAAAWLLMLLVSIANGAVRDFIYGRHMRELRAHQLSTFTSILLLGAIIWGFVHFHPPQSELLALAIGASWAALTLFFEFLFFHFVGRRSWSELLANYNVRAGRVWVFVLLWLAVAPYVFLHFHLA